MDGQSIGLLTIGQANEEAKSQRAERRRREPLPAWRWPPGPACVLSCLLAYFPATPHRRQAGRGRPAPGGRARRILYASTCASLIPSG